MAVYIEREAVIDIIEQVEWYHIHNGCLCNGAPTEESGLYKTVDIFEALYRVPANDNDVVKVVRCKNCIYSSEDDFDGTLWCCRDAERETEDKHFCSYGERRGE